MDKSDAKLMAQARAAAATKKTETKPVTTTQVDSRAALMKLTSGQTLNDAEKKILNIAPTPAPTPAVSASPESQGKSDRAYDEKNNIVRPTVTPTTTTTVTTVVSSPVTAVPATVSPVVVPPPAPPIKTAPIDTVLFNDSEINIELYTDLLFENIGGQEILSLARYDTVNGQPVKYQPIKNLDIIQQDYNPNNLLRLQKTSQDTFNNYSIKFAEKIPDNTNDPSGENANAWFAADGSIVIELVNLLTDEQVEIQMAFNGTIDEIGI